MREKDTMGERNYGLDAARVCAMCGIIILHILGQGGVLAVCQPNSGHYWVSWWLEICAYCSVDLFALISGWLGIYKKKNSVFRSLELIGIVIFYSVLFTVLFLLAEPSVFSGYRDVVNSVFPVLAGRYWYITCYIPLAVLQPFLNKMLLVLSEKQHRVLCLLCILLFALVPSVFRVDFFAFKDGYSFVWLAVCYMIGAYLRRIESQKKETACKARYLGLFFAGSLVLLLGNILINYISGYDWHYFISYTSPVTLLMAAAFLLYMKSIDIKHGRTGVMQAASVAFDIYVIQCHILIYDRILKDRFLAIAGLPSAALPAAVIGCALSMYLVLSLDGGIRRLLFEKSGVNRLCKSAALRIDNARYWE